MDSKVDHLHSRAISLVTKFQQGGGKIYIDEAVVLDREALELCPHGHPKRYVALTWLAVHLNNRYNQLGAMADLEEAIVLGRYTLALCTVKHPGRSTSLNNLAVRLCSRYRQLGAMDDLNEAIILDREALALRPPGHPDHSTSLSSLASRLYYRYNQLGAMEDLNEAIVLGRDTLALRPLGHHRRSNPLHNLAGLLYTRYNHLREMEDLNEAIVLGRDALTLRPLGHHLRSSSLHNLAACIYIRYTELGVMEDLNEVIIFARDALALRSLGHPLRSTSLSNLAIYFSTRYKQLGVMDDINEAIVFARDALVIRPSGHPSRSQTLNILADHLRTRFTRSSQLQDKEELFDFFAQLEHTPSVVSSADLSATRAWIRVAEYFHHPTTLLAYKTSLRLLIQHLATLPSLPQHLTVLKSLTSELAVDAFSACLRNHTPADAIVLLEQGRGVFWNQLTRLRPPLDDVIASGAAGKMLADEFTQQTLQIRDALDSPGAEQHDRVCRLNIELERVVTKIRGLPGLSRFLLPSLFPDLQQAAREGPVIIVNASKYGCDALVVLVDRHPLHIPLSITKEDVREMSKKLGTLTVSAKSMDVTKDLAIMLRELWDEVISPIVNLLQTIHPSQSRIWWCPTAEFSLLPLHAAGPFRKGQQNLAHMYISSYTPTLTALIRARRHNVPQSASKGKYFVGIGQARARMNLSPSALSWPTLVNASMVSPHSPTSRDKSLALPGSPRNL